MYALTIEPDSVMFDFASYYDMVAERLPDNCKIAEVGIANGKSASSTRNIARNNYFDQSNNISVVVQREGGKVVTVCHGELK